MSLAPFSTPVLLLVFRRVDTTAAVLEVLAKIKPRRLYVAADAPLQGDAVMEAACAATRQLVETRLTWPCEVFRHYADTHLGCRRGVAEALGWFFSKESEGIVLEDDVVPDLSFFPYCEELLERYRDDSRIGCISGLNLLGDRAPSGASYRFSIYNHCWGWASWRRAWNFYDADLAGWPSFRDGRWLEALGGKRFSAFFSRQLERVRGESCDTWDYIWAYSLWRQGMLTCVPTTNLIRNIGVGHASATHTLARSSSMSYRIASPGTVGTLDLPLRHPEVIRADQVWDRKIFRRHHHPPLALRAYDRLLRLVSA